MNPKIEEKVKEVKRKFTEEFSMVDIDAHTCDGWNDLGDEFMYKAYLGADTFTAIQSFLTQALSEIYEQGKKEGEIYRIEGTLRRIQLNESNDYPIVDESKSLADVKEALENRLKQLTAK